MDAIFDILSMRLVFRRYELGSMLDGFNGLPQPLHTLIDSLRAIRYQVPMASLN